METSEALVDEPYSEGNACCERRLKTAEVCDVAGRVRARARERGGDGGGREMKRV
jgi:hypothetical protein